MKRMSVSDLEWADRFTYVKNVLFEAEDLAQEGARFQIVKFKPGSSIKPHHHEQTHEIFYIREGSGILEMNGEKFEIGADDVFLCEPGDRHAFFNTGETELVVLIFKTNEGGDGDIYWE